MATLESAATGVGSRIISDPKQIESRSRAGGYASDFITENYTLSENQADLNETRKATPVKAATLYNGRSILTPHAGIQLRTQIEAYLKKELLPQFYLDQKKTQAEQQSGDYLGKDLETTLTWYETTTTKSANLARDPAYNALRALKELKGLNCLSQSLSGFNEALLMHKQTMQLDIADPLGFDDYQSFAETVRRRSRIRSIARRNHWMISIQFALGQ